MEYSVLFYGYYDSDPYDSDRLFPLKYKLPLAYIFTVIALFIFYCITILIKYV